MTCCCSAASAEAGCRGGLGARRRTIPGAWRSGMGTLLLDGVTLIDGSGAAPLADAALVIEDERIAYAGPRGAAPERAATRRLDGRGLTALPGLIDLHQHSTADADLRAFLARGVPSIRYAGLNQATVRALQGRVAAGELPGT